MPFEKVSFFHFRNIIDDTIDLLSREVYFVGTNGQGKSNILESLYLSAYGSSFRTNTDTEICTGGSGDYAVSSFFEESNGYKNNVIVQYAQGKKRILTNERPITDRRELIKNIPCVLFCHEDLDFVHGSPERKRWFLDQTLSMYNETYLETLRNYKKVLKSRNVLLKDKYELNTELLRSLSHMLVQNGLQLTALRSECISGFNEFFGDVYNSVTGIDGITMVYDASWKTSNEEETYNHLLEKECVDIAMGTTMSGPHRDRVKFLRDGKPFVPCASTGQRRLLSLLLRTVQAIFYTKKTGKKPVLLMDDVMLELDIRKREKFFETLPDYDQLFCTFLPEEPYSLYQTQETRIYQIDKGRWTNG